MHNIQPLPHVSHAFSPHLTPLLHPSPSHALMCLSVLYLHYIHSVLDALKWVTPKLGRALWTRVWPFTRKYTMILALDCSPGMLARLFAYVDDGSLKCIVDPNGPFDFSTEGVRAAFEVLQSRRAKGKVVIKIADE
ncbi:hypothetical protein SARC_05900 [Sphaeroforma arctica JP610]|uniref:Uncharacterized protein n=1 Tax=Sphaeroforma arctica JP610 TaxID=667725 RepID=A0A0L0FY80_9EUKA|nr:hypothetical protein SARC_05900 [Sphaeroforma arctica JP610]KNC81795.1 hypothetical protein SARC_05900 [Sphaeroforma arctica JP610]|eukprot:XP_014155697.1 hypothetical protein SARC_05900 [Sphaeroforma arctica JP610]